MITSQYRSKVNSKTFKFSNTHFVLIAIFYAFFFLFANFGISFNFGVIIVSFVLIVVTLLKVSMPIEIKTKKLLCLLIVVILTIVLNIRNISFLTTNPMFIYSMAITSFSFAFIEPDFNSKKLILNILLISSFLSLLIVYISYLFPTVYLSYIAPKISPSVFEEIKSLMDKGYSGTMGGNISLTANYLALGIAIYFGKYLADQKRRHLFFIVLFFVGLFFVNRRSELLAATVALFAMIFFASKRSTKAIISFFFLIFVLISLLCLYSISTGSIKYSGTNRTILSVFELLQGRDISNGRSGLYKLALQLFKENPIFGIGWGNFRFYGNRQLNQITNVHNIYLQLLCEIGIIGAIIILGAILYITVKIFKNFKQSTNSRTVRLTGFSLFSIIYILILGIFDNPIFQDSFWLLFGLIIVCAFKNQEEKKKDKI